MAVDLHLHSQFSDGTDPPQAIVAEAERIGLSAIALTDHDTLAGIAEARDATTDRQVRLLPGLELSVGWPTGTMHLLVYFLEPGAGPLQDRLAAIRRSRAERNVRIVAKLAELDIDISYEEVKAVAPPHDQAVIGRPHIARVLVAKGAAADNNDAFDRYLGSGRPAYFERDRLGAVEAIELARASAAVPVIAHPHTLGVGRDEYADAFRTLVEAGLGGIEAFYGDYDLATTHHLVSLCAGLGIAATGGSDYHGANKPGLEIGSGRGDLSVPDEAVHQLMAQQAL